MLRSVLYSKNDEQLRETLVDLEIARAREREERLLAEGLYEGLKIISVEGPASDCFRRLLEYIREIIGCDQAAILFYPNEPLLRFVYCTNKEMQDGSFPVSENVLKKIISPRALNFFDAEALPELAPFFPPKADAIGSLLLSGVCTRSGLYLLSLTSGRRAAFTRHHAALAYKMAIVIGQRFEKEEYVLQLIQSQKLSALGQMAGGIAHEINNPLTSLTFSAHLLTGLLKSEPIDREKCLEVVARNQNMVQRIARIVTGIRNLSRKETEATLTVFKMADVLQDILSCCEEKFRVAGIRLTSVCKGGIERVAIRGHRLHLSEILLNLLNNAYDAVPKTPDAWVRVEVWREDKTLHLRVSDSGKGIPPSVAKRIFDPFFTTKEVGRGTGLGLSLCLEFAAAMGGRIYLDSSHPNTSFKVEIPFLEAPA